MRTLCVTILILTSYLLIAQSPEAIQYQAVARDGTGQLLTNQSLTVRLSVKANGPAGSTVYQETHSASTNDYGLFTLLIGQGNPTTGTFSTIDWGNSSHFLRVEVDDGSGYVDLGTTQFVAVPYALYAKEAGNSGGSYNAGTGLDLNGQTFSAQTQSALWNANALQGRPVSNTGPGSGQVLKWNGSQWAPAADDNTPGLWSQQGQHIYYQGGRVGIGLTNPVVPFQVAANQTVLFGNSDRGAGHKWIYNPTKNALRSGEVTASQKDIWNPDSLGSGSFGHGINVVARGPGSVAFGSNSLAAGDYTFSSGIDSRATGHFAAALGASAYATGANSFASGFQVHAQGNQSIAIGHLDTASGDNSMAIGIGSAATGDGAIAMGEEAKAYGGSSLALGTNVIAQSGGIAMGDDAFATDIYAIAMGKGVTASGEFSVALGGSPTASGNFSTSIGFLTQAQGFAAIAMGEGDTASGNHSIAMGLYSAATDNGAVAIGRQATSRGEGVAIGSRAFALNDGDVALGKNNEARGGSSFAAGFGNITYGAGATALGSDNAAFGTASTALGIGNIANGPATLVTGQYAQPLNNLLFNIGSGAPQVPRTVFAVTTNGRTGIQNNNPSGLLHVGDGLGAELFIGSAENLSDGGSFTLLCDTDLDPETDGGHTLGSSSLRWNRLYTANGVITTSDAREKQNIVDLPYGLTTLMALRPVAYEWKEGNPDRSQQLGLLAQDLQQVIPEVVVDSDFETDEETGAVKEVPADKLGVEYSQLIPVLIKSVQEQQATIKSLQAEVNYLKSKLED